MLKLHENYRALWATARCAILPDEFYSTPWLALDLSKQNKKLPAADLSEVLSLEPLIYSWIQNAGCRVGYGGHGEARAWYQASSLFSGPEGPRSTHLGVDLWVPAETPIRATWDGVVHSFKDNANFLDYGPTIILQHESQGLRWHSLHGHLSRRSLEGLDVGAPVRAGSIIGETGRSNENGAWIPHLHFELVIDMKGYVGDFPGVCTPARAPEFLSNCPDPALLLRPQLVHQEQFSLAASAV